MEPKLNDVADDEGPAKVVDGAEAVGAPKLNDGAKANDGPVKVEELVDAGTDGVVAPNEKDELDDDGPEAGRAEWLSLSCVSSASSSSTSYRCNIPSA